VMRSNFSGGIDGSLTADTYSALMKTTCVASSTELMELKRC
jgi:hypothetical protein